MSKSIYLSPSMQENNTGALNYGTEETRMNQIADIVQKVLKDYGVDVYRNRPEWSLAQAVNDSNRVKPNLHFCIHSNAGGGRGAEIYAYAPGGEGEKAAMLIYAEISAITPTADRGVQFNPSLYELRNTNAPAALVEVAYHDNAEDATWIMNNIESIGIALAKGVLKYFGISYKDPKDTQIDDKILYRVMAGSYSIKENAENQVRDLKNAGFDSVIMIFNKS
jgi:N-acetylmuramoyl-L-alanine amidase